MGRERFPWHRDTHTHIHKSLPQSRGRAHIYHSIGGDPEEGGSFVDRFDLFPALGRQLKVLQLTQGSLESRPVLGDQVVESAEVIQFPGEVFQGAVHFALVGLRGGFLVVARVICEKGRSGRVKGGEREEGGGERPSFPWLQAGQH